MIVAFISLLYAGLTWWVPNKASSMCGRVALGLSGATVVAVHGRGRGWRWPAYQAVRGVSRMIEGRAT